MATLTFKVEEDYSLLRLDIYLVEHIKDAPSRSYLQKLIDAKCVSVNKKFFKSNHKVAAGDVIEVNTPKDFGANNDVVAEKIPIDIFYEDEHLLIVNKACGMMVHPATGIYSGTLVNALLAHCQSLSDLNSSDEAVRPGIVHRLDKETSGLMVVAKDNVTHADLAKQFQKHEVKKRYVALVKGRVEFDQGKVDVSLGRHPTHRQKKSVRFDEAAKEAVTFYEVLKRHEGVTLLALLPRTGRTHQLRVHMAYLNHPILGDDKYGRKDTFPRLALHAQSLGFTHPHTNEYLEFSSKIPQEFLAKVNFRSAVDIQKVINN